MPIPSMKALFTVDAPVTIPAGQEYVIGPVALILVPYLNYVLNVSLPGVRIDGTSGFELWLRIDGVDQFKIAACGNDSSQGAVQGYPISGSCLLPAQTDYGERAYAVAGKAIGRQIEILSGGGNARGYTQVIEFGQFGV